MSKILSFELMNLHIYNMSLSSIENETFLTNISNVNLIDSRKNTMSVSITDTVIKRKFIYDNIISKYCNITFHKSSKSPITNSSTSVVKFILKNSDCNSIFLNCNSIRKMRINNNVLGFILVENKDGQKFQKNIMVNGEFILHTVVIENSENNSYRLTMIDDKLLK